mmetsp:Transcript_1006/g.1278  ORF Transcript_1006/g.1278 Transcript_1006/m.1278 type:complete len:106 (+) Transcript_1006:90-407(+)
MERVSPRGSHFRERRWKKQRQRRLPPPKTTLAAVLMLSIGGVLFCLGALITWGKFSNKKDRERGLAMLVIGSILLLPGSYASVTLYGAYQGWPGYHYSAIPSYDD